MAVCLEMNTTDIDDIESDDADNINRMVVYESTFCWKNRPQMVDSHHIA